MQVSISQLDLGRDFSYSIKNESAVYLKSLQVHIQPKCSWVSAILTLSFQYRRLGGLTQHS